MWHTKVHTTNKSQTLRQPEKQRQQEHQYTCTRVTVVSGNYINIYISKQHTHTHTPTHTLTLTHTVTRAAYAGSCCCCVLSALRSTTCYMHRATRRMSYKCRKQKRWNAESKPSTRMDNICVSACVCGGRGAGKGLGIHAYVHWEKELSVLMKLKCWIKHSEQILCKGFAGKCFSLRLKIYGINEKICQIGLLRERLVSVE